MNPIQVTVNCRICRRPVTVTVIPHPDVDMERFIHMACHDGCVDARYGRRARQASLPPMNEREISNPYKD
jgi:hypothetical protein